MRVSFLLTFSAIVIIGCNEAPKPSASNLAVSPVSDEITLNGVALHEDIGKISSRLGPGWSITKWQDSDAALTLSNGTSQLSLFHSGGKVHAIDGLTGWVMMWQGKTVVKSGEWVPDGEKLAIKCGLSRAAGEVNNWVVVEDTAQQCYLRIRINDRRTALEAVLSDSPKSR